MPVQDLTVSGSPELTAKKSPGNTQNAETRPQKVGFVSLGCPKNLVDSEVMMGMLAQAGAELTRRAEDADVIVVNTCSFIESAQQESINTILEMAGHKATGKAKKLVVAGCLVERFRDQIRKNIPEVDAVVGTGELVNILSATGVAAAHSAKGLSTTGFLPCIEGLAGVVAVQGQPTWAARPWGMSEAFREAMGTSMPPIERPDYERSVAAARSHVGDLTFAAGGANRYRIRTISDRALTQCYRVIGAGVRSGAERRGVVAARHRVGTHRDRIRAACLCIRTGRQRVRTGRLRGFGLSAAI